MRVLSCSNLSVALYFGLCLGVVSCSGNETEVNPSVNPDPAVEDDGTSGHNFSATSEAADSTFAANRVLDVQVTIAEEDWNVLRFEHRKPVEFFGEGCRDPIPDAFNYYPAEVSIDGTSLGQVGVRTKGLVGSINPARPSLKVKLQEYQDENYYQDRKRFTFNNQTSDQARLSTCMAYYIFRQMGVPASRCNFAKMTVNEYPLGVYANVEPIKKPMLQRLFGDDSGNLYEGTVSDIRTGFSGRVEKKTNEDENDWSDFEALLAAVEAPDDEFIERIGEVLDVDAFLRFTAASVLVGHWDSFSGNANNYYFYHDPGTQKFYFLPWGPDDTFSNRNLAPNGRIQAAMGGSLLARRLFEDSVIMTRYRDIMWSMLNELWDDDTIMGELDRMEALVADHVVGMDESTHRSNVQAVRDFLTDRKRLLLNAINADPIPFTEPLPEDLLCLQYSGDMNVTFESQWGSLGAENPFSTGSGTFEADYGFINFDAQALGVAMGEIGSPGATEIDFIALIQDGQFMFVRLMLPTSAIEANSTFEMGDPRVSSLVILITEGEGFQIFGFLSEGTLTFGDEVELSSGGTVRGELSVGIWGGLPAVED